MIWRDDELKNPLSGKFLRRDSPHSFSDGENRFPVVEEIPFLRVNREGLCAAALRKLDAGETRGALVLLLQDRDDWARGDAPTEADLQPLFENENINLRQAMRHLQYGAVADYFAYRWSDPTFLSGLCLLETHLPTKAKTVFELCCGIGHYLREFDLRSIEATGADVVFSKLWLARKFVAPNAKLVCLDANFDLPFGDKIFDAAFCHDAFYFLPEKARVAAELKRTTGGTILIGHAHNADAENFSSGAAVNAREYAEFFSNEKTSLRFYDDEELTRAVVENRRPAAQKIDELKRAAAIDLVYRAKETDANGHRLESFLSPSPHRRTRTNPLLLGKNDEILRAPFYPSERYAEEYGALSGYLNLSEKDAELLRTARRSTDEKPIDDKDFGELLRRRILLDLPDNW